MLMRRFSTNAPTRIISELIPDLLGLCRSSLPHTDNTVSLQSLVLCKGHVYKNGRRQSRSSALAVSRVDGNHVQVRGCAMLGPSKDALLVMGLLYW